MDDIKSIRLEKGNGDVDQWKGRYHIQDVEQIMEGDQVQWHIPWKMRKQLLELIIFCSLSQVPSSYSFIFLSSY